MLVFFLNRNMQLEKLTLTIQRSSIQGGIPNERYPLELLYDIRKSYHIVTDAVAQWKGYRCAGFDAKFTDLSCLQNPRILAEGKNINKKRGISLKPSVDCGGGRKFSQENLEKCLAKNAFYFFYTIASHTETTLTFEVYWVPIALVNQWYATYGNQGVLSYKSFQRCLTSHVIVETKETRST